MIEYHHIERDDRRPAPNTTEARRATPWHLMSNNTLIYAYHLLALHQSPYLGEVVYEINTRVDIDEWADIDNPPPPLGDVPLIFHYWPFSLLWKQKSS